MFCPKCATQNLDGASFCRSCGANVSLVPQALSGKLEQPSEETGKSSWACSTSSRREPSIESTFKSVFMGIAFLLIAMALAFSRMGSGWWFWMLIPAFMFLGTGVAHYMRLKDREKRAFQPGSFGQPNTLSAPQQVASIPTRQTGELVAPPPSVTEGTTRHLGAEAATKHFGAPADAPK